MLTAEVRCLPPTCWIWCWILGMVAPFVIAGNSVPPYQYTLRTANFRSTYFRCPPTTGSTSNVLTITLGRHKSGHRLLPSGGHELLPEPHQPCPGAAYGHQLRSSKAAVSAKNEELTAQPKGLTSTNERSCSALARLYSQAGQRVVAILLLG